MPVFINKTKNDIQNRKPPFGILKDVQFDFKNKVVEHNLSDYTPTKVTEIGVSLRIPQEDINQYFIQWQRYRKYWWSSITTTPSLFTVDDVKQTDTESNVDIIAKLPCGTQPVEHIKVQKCDENQKFSSLTCSMNLENALLTLLLDGSTSQDEYLRLHRKLAPYKISFALNFEGNKESLEELAKLLYYRLKIEKISVWLPDFTMAIDEQIRENLHMGVTYTAILSENTLQDGVFHLMSSSTTLKEQVHVADFHTYAALLCRS